MRYDRRNYWSHSLSVRTLAFHAGGTGSIPVGTAKVRTKKCYTICMAYKNKDEQRAFQIAWKDTRRQEFIDSRGGCCEKCGSFDRLEVDHIDKSLKTMNPTRIWSRREEVRDAELANCQVLCYACHKEKTTAERYVDHPHGVYGRYKYGCRCSLCRAANAKRSRMQRGRE